MTSSNPLAPDLEMILSRTEQLWGDLRGGRVFITGGTGFFGRWLLESFAWANRRLELKAEAVVLTRNPAAFQKTAPNLAGDAAIQFHPGDVRKFVFPAGKFSHVIHGATPASAMLNAENPHLMFDTIVQGTQRTLDFAAHSSVKKFLFISSGAVYGRQPRDVSHIAEDFFDRVDIEQPLGAYAEGKRAGEKLCVGFGAAHALEMKIARCFTFVGPHLPLDAHYAVGNFMRDGLRGGPIRVQGDGTPMRSYLHAAELTVWLWTILFRGENARAYNLGSETCLSIAEAACVASGFFLPPVNVEVASTPETGPAARYVPSTQRAQIELGLRQEIESCNAILKTLGWLQNENARSK
jgi:nucleoside-diphosphate-sugar epimerase